LSLGSALDLRLEPLKKFDAKVAAKVAGGATVNQALCEMLAAGGRPNPELSAQMRLLMAKSTF
jgi:hypothetical protein